ncbi:HAD family hydrolase [Flavobacterium sp. NG2]|uniref:HAD family hydrolase n=1 Tax=Flavobacterium sp. NG2 TaxID=3097547 RepID=UPI002A807AD2|nr:HAD family hydrolase [Flavobacterium sp. NG2]WPR70540.1 HAD family hydrolase [Flavobacterium sp. NG2]
MKFKGVIFDLDGTLVNSLEDISDAMNTVLQELQYPTHTYDTYQYFIGSGLRNLVSKALPITNNSETDIQDCYDRMITVYRQNCTHKTNAYDGIFELLAELKSRNIPISVFSNKADDLTKEVSNTIFPNYFDPILGLTTEAQKKPNPSKAIEISENWNIKPEETLFVGDSDIDMLTATNANMYAVGVIWGYRTKEELLADGAQQILNYPMELIALF